MGLKLAEGNLGRHGVRHALVSIAAVCWLCTKALFVKDGIGGVFIEKLLPICFENRLTGLIRRY